MQTLAITALRHLVVVDRFGERAPHQEIDRCRRAWSRTCRWFGLLESAGERHCGGAPEFRCPKCGERREQSLSLGGKRLVALSEDAPDLSWHLTVLASRKVERALWMFKFP